MNINLELITKLRATTGAGMLDCKKALEEAQGNFDNAIDILRKTGATKAAKRADKIAAEGIVFSYIHAGGKVGVLVEINCETDFVAKTDNFQNLAKDVAMHIAAAAPKCLTSDEIPEEDMKREEAIYRDQLKAEGKPEDMIEKILEGKMSKYYGEVCLLNQSFIKDEDKTIETLLTEKSAEIGEKISIRRFTRYEMGEGIEKKVQDFVAEVQEQL
ncbi:translation elongation factor Ts [Patescibacteria group bacterium]|nr:translation elongation factor Ts [Patescibacteria group bacterium]